MHAIVKYLAALLMIATSSEAKAQFMAQGIVLDQYVPPKENNNRHAHPKEKNVMAETGLDIVKDQVPQAILSIHSMPKILNGNPAIVPLLQNYDNLNKIANGSEREKMEGGVGLYKNYMLFFPLKDFIGGLFPYSIDALSGNQPQ